MPFLLIAREGEDWPFVDEEQLKRRLCPYVGPLHVVTVGDRRLYHSRLGHPSDDPVMHRVIFAPDGRKAPHVAWACVEISVDGQRLSTDPLGQVPLWRHDGPGYRAWAPEAKAAVSTPPATTTRRRGLKNSMGSESFSLKNSSV
jgi:hypothetical protein